MSLNTILATAPLTTTNYILKATGTTIGNSSIFDNGTNVGIGNTNTSYTLDVSGTLRNTTSAYFATTSGSVGIGTATPSYKFEVSNLGAGVTVGDFYVDTANNSVYVGRQSTTSGDNSKFYVRNRVNTLTALSVDPGGNGAVDVVGTFSTTRGTNLATATGNVGIGTSSPTSGSSFNRFLEINGGSVNSALCLSGLNVAGQATIGYDSGNLYIEALGNPTGTNNNILFSTTSVNSSFTRIERMRITSSGQLGIGTPAVDSTLSVDIQNTSPTSNNVFLRIKNNVGSEDTGIKIAGTYGTAYEHTFGVNTIINSGDLIFHNSDSLGYRWYINGTQRMYITNAGKINIGVESNPSSTQFNVAGADTSNDLGKFYINSASSLSQALLRLEKYDNNNSTSQVFVNFTINQQATANGSITGNGASQVTFTSWSDRRLKENITELPNQLQNILALKPSEFDYKDGSGHQIGFIAQEIQEVYPDSVGENALGFLTVAGWNKTEAILVKAIQEQQIQIQNLQEQINILAK
jgi:hypothetical protein